MFDDSRALSSDSDSNSMFSQNPKPKLGLFPNIFMESANTESGNQQNSGLLRLRSAPCSLLEDFTHGVEKNRGSVSRFNLGRENGRLASRGSLNLEENSLVNGIYGLPPQYPRQNLGTQLVDGGILGSNLMRQNSSPPSLFSHLTSQNGYAVMNGGVGGYRMARSSHGDLNSPLSYSSGAHSSLGVLSRITEIENESNVETSPDDDEKPAENGDSDTQFYGSGFPFTSWSDSTNYADNLNANGLKRELDNEPNLFLAANKTQVGDVGTQPQTLSRCLSLPKTSAEIGALEKLSQFPDTVPWNIRAKRGCATHPRSIAERIRRTRISERMRKLQELVPNMDKQTNTADMLDFAVEYIKDLQRQYKILADYRENCKCSAMQKPVPNERL